MAEKAQENVLLLWNPSSAMLSVFCVQWFRSGSIHDVSMTVGPMGIILSCTLLSTAAPSDSLHQVKVVKVAYGGPLEVRFYPSSSLSGFLGKRALSSLLLSSSTCLSATQCEVGGAKVCLYFTSDLAQLGAKSASGWQLNVLIPMRLPAFSVTLPSDHVTMCNRTLGGSSLHCSFPFLTISLVFCIP